MARRTLAETTEWVVDSLKEVEQVSEVQILSEQVICVQRTKYDPFIAGIVSVNRVEADDIRPIVNSNHGVEIIANIPKEAFWTGEALKLAQANDTATGALGDLYRAIKLENVRGFEPKETAFIERGLRQHSRIDAFVRVHDRLYRISRNGLPDLTVVMLNEYELTADHLRTARDRYGRFSVAVITNPNGRGTTSAKDAADALGAEVHNWKSFFARLNKE